MKLLLAAFKHETNTFSPVPTPPSRFFVEGRLLEHGAALKHYSNTGSVLGGFLASAGAAGAAVTLPVAADGWPSGPVHDDAFELIAGKICDALRSNSFDGILLDLHGAMVCESYADGEGELLRRVRTLAPDTPLAVALDMHANVSPEMVEASDIVCGYQTYPHVDERMTGLRAARLLLGMLRGQLQPVLAWGSAPMLPHVMAQSSLDEPNRSLQTRCAAISDEGALDASLFTGFPHADTPHAGLSAVVMTDGAIDLATELRDALLAAAWERRAAFRFTVEPLAKSVCRAMELTQSGRLNKPAFLLDHYDNAASGGSMQELTVLEEILRQGLSDAVFFAILAPRAVDAARAAGVGKTVRLELERPGAAGVAPLVLEGIVRRLSDGLVDARNNHHEGVLLEMGPSALVRVSGIDLILVSLPMEPYDVACLGHFGIDARSKRFIVLKSRVHWRAAFEEMVGAIVPCAGTGACTSNYDELSFRAVRRPVYPLDAEAALRPITRQKPGPNHGSL